MRRAITTLIVWAALSSVVVGQAVTTGRITGRVVDESGEPVAGARVSLISSALQGERATTTETDGHFLAALLPIGPYAVSVAAPGMQTLTVSLRVTVGGTEPLRLSLKPGEGLEEKVTVTGSTTPLETTVVGENFNYDKMVEELPIADRELETVAKLAPNVGSLLTTSDPGSSRYLVISGAVTEQTAILLDGAELTDQLGFLTRQQYLEDAVEELQVLTTGVSARYGRFAGGVLNAITKSGGNTFDGTVRAEFSKETWNEQTPFGEEQSNDLNEVYQATLGGYVLKDRFWFFAGGRTIPTQSFSGRTVLTNEDFVEEHSEDRWQIKLRGVPVANHTLEVSYLDYELEITDGDGGQGVTPGDLQAATSDGIFPGDLTTLTYQAVLGQATFLEAVASERNVRSDRGGPAELGSPILDDFETGAFFNNVWSSPDDPVDRDNEAFSANLTHLFSTDGHGTHTLEAGVQYVKSISAGANVWSSTGFFWSHEINDAPYPFVELGAAPGEVLFNVNSTDQRNVRYQDLPLGGNQELENLALYAHDSWQLGKWRVDAGLRWESYEGTGPTGEDLGIDMDEFAPRLGLTYHLRPDLQLQAFWGKYVARLEDVFIVRNTGLGFSPSIARLYAGPEVLDATAADLDALLRDDANWGELVELLDPENPTTLLADDLEPPTATDFNLSVRYGLPRSSGTVTLSYIDRTYDDIFDPQVGDFGTTEVPAPDGPEVLVVDTVVLDNGPGAKRTYEALAATWDYRPSARWDVGGNWTWSETRGNVDDNVFEGVIGTALGTYERSRPQDAAVPFGFLSWDRTHTFRLWGNYRFDLGKAGSLALGGIGRFESGATWSRRASVDFSDDPVYLNETSNTYVHYFDGLGNNDFDDWWSLDLSGRYQFPIGKGVNGWVKATVVNVFDNDELLTFRTSGSATTSPPADCPGCVTDEANGLTWVPSSSFGMARSPFHYQTPRSYLFTLGLTF